MIRSKIKLLGVVLLISLSNITIPSVFAQSFDPVFEWVRRFQNGDKIELKILVDNESFTLFTNKQTNIDRSTFEQIRKGTPAQQIKIIPDVANKKLEGLILTYQVDKLLYLEEIWKGENPTAWRKIELLPMASYSLDYWVDFIKQAISQGLMEYEITEYAGNSFASLSFKQIDPPNIHFGERLLKFPDEFYEYMRISRDFKFHTGNTKKVVVLVHEPHWLLLGQYQLIPGLKAFLEANSQYNFRFLVEGDWEEEIKYIPTQSTLDIFSKDASTATQVFSLLRNFLIDGPFAYRLLYAPDLPALAIDDRRSLKKSPREPNLKDHTEEWEVFAKINEKLDRIPKEQKLEASQILALLSYYVMADAENLKGEALIDYYKQLTEFYNALSNQLNSINAKEFEKERLFLNSQAESWRIQTIICQYALKRDDVMVKHITDHFNSDSAEKIPIVFIGNFHTAGIIDRLPQGISYVVIEPRLTPLSLIPPQRERDNFNDALNPETRLNYLKKLGSRKGQVAPLGRELIYYKAFIEKEAQGIKTLTNTFKASSPLSDKNTLNLINVLELNGVFNGAKYEFAGDGVTPPPPFQGAFASFAYDPEGKSSKMSFYNSKDEGWNRLDRYAYLQNVLPVLPYEKVQKGAQRCSFYQNKETKRLFLCFFDSQTRTFYLFDGEEVMNVLKLLAVVKPAEKENEVLMQIKSSFLNTIHKKKDRICG